MTVGMGPSFRFGSNVHAERDKAQKEATAAREEAQQATAEKEAASKKAAEEAAKRHELCIVKAAELRVKAENACPKEEPNRNACVTDAEAVEKTAIAQCAVDSSDRDEAEKAAEEAREKAKEAKEIVARHEQLEACLKVAETEEAATKAGCPKAPAETKITCEKNAELTAAKARLKCREDFGG